MTEEFLKDLFLSDHTPTRCLPDTPEQADWQEEAMLQVAERLYTIA